jgi:Arc/MetJ-type ribon-helix-helix transcriptional regulator
MARGRKANSVPTTQWSIMIPIDLAFRVETRLMDPVTRTARYGSRSLLIQALLQEWLHREGAAALPLDTLQEAADNSREESPIPPAHTEETPT